MAEYRIICTTQEPSNVPNDRAHIVAVARGLARDEFDGCLSARARLNLPSRQSRVHQVNTVLALKGPTTRWLNTM
jgi:hypothetical protein